ncbi:cytoplasmic iron level regulating protein YaaA (DUF328/UPF0246 family) [Lactobacillus colini]|uniref:UPF0246 protein J2Z60_001349 n=1 Tax=Lactobacillus colini TaxID=1819254 RepID=A0ABS4MFM3_9LACO|nr:peroxide stress protein YaaA [Lactobacillus colini]MBP2058172.1 cytoplasmic iron level regulating protein YaaA (DUF328/UPF0246 family) [Lactobacillus colini]
MKIIIAPAKKMQIDRDSFAVESMPIFLDKARVLWDFLKSRDFDQLKEIWQANDKIVRENMTRLNYEELDQQLTPAMMAYNGIQYQYLAGDVLERAGLEYLQKNLRILSGLYGVLRPFDGVVPYRLEMRTGMVGFADYSLYHYWGESIAQEIFKEDNLVINLASKEYSRLLEPYVKDGQRIITVTFLERKNDKWRQIATHAKMARGAMVHFMAANQVTKLDDLKDFHDFGYQYDASSTMDKIVFKKME